MAYGVSGWPSSSDPRSVNYNMPGWAAGATPPYHWLIKSSDALPPFDVFNAGLLIPWLSGDAGHVDWELKVGAGQPIHVIMGGSGWLIEDSPIAPDTQQFSIVIDAGLAGTATAELKQVLPLAIREQGPLLVAGSPSFDAKVPNDITLLPAIWNY